MDLRSSSATAALALLIASAGSALLTPAIQAGERIQFSVPTFPLAIPHPNVEIKDSEKPASSTDISGSIAGDDQAGGQTIMVVQPKHKEENSWDTTPILGEDKDKSGIEDWITARSEPNLFTNKSSSMPHGWDPNATDDLIRQRNDLGSENEQRTTRFGSPIDLYGQNTADLERNVREIGRFGRDASDDGNTTSSSWLKTFERDSMTMDKERESFSSAGYSTFKDEALSFGNNTHQPRANESKPDMSLDRSTGLPSGFDNYSPFDNSQNRLTSEQIGQQFGTDQSLRAWGQLPSAPRNSTSRSIFGAPPVSSTRVVAPVRPINLPFPKRPGDY